MLELASQIAPSAAQSPPLVLVVDMDETLVYVDEDGVDETRNGCLCVYRVEIFVFFTLIRRVFGKRLFLVLWSTGTGDYVKHMLTILGLNDFDLILTRSDAEKSKEMFGSCKSPSYIIERSKFSEWLDALACSAYPRIPVWAIIDDKARQNTSVDEPYHFTFSPKPLCPRNINFSKMHAKIQSLFEYADILIFHLLLRSDKTFEILNKSNNMQANNFYSFFVQPMLRKQC